MGKKIHFWIAAVILLGADWLIAHAEERRVPEQIGAIGLWRRTDFRRFCSGAQIGDRWILSAAHCFANIRGDEGQMVYFPGKFRANTNAEINDSIPIARIFMPKDYMPAYIDSLRLSTPENPAVLTTWATNRSDFALVELTRPLHTAPLPVFSSERSFRVGNLLWTAGYPSNRPEGTAWTTSGPVLDVDSGVAISQMEIASGASGSPLMTTSGFRGAFIVGVVIARPKTLAGQLATATSHVFSPGEIAWLRQWMRGDTRDATVVDGAFSPRAAQGFHIFLRPDGTPVEKGILVRNPAGYGARMTFSWHQHQGRDELSTHTATITLPFERGEARYLRFVRDWSEDLDHRTPVRMVWAE